MNIKVKSAHRIDHLRSYRKLSNGGTIAVKVDGDGYGACATYHDPRQEFGAYATGKAARSAVANVLRQIRP